MTREKQAGFTLIETMVGLAVLFAVGGIVMSGMVQLMRTQGTIANRTDMHTSVRSATELLQQEIGQAGRLSLAGPGANVTVAPPGVVLGAFTLVASDGSPVNVYPGEALTFDLGTNQEVVQLATGSGASGTGLFQTAHAAGTPVTALGAFSTGIVPPGAAPPNSPGSSGTVLKLYGDINGDGKMMYVEYTCVQGQPAAPGTLYRNAMPITTPAPKPAFDNTMILLNNVLTNPNDVNGNPVPCFAYQVQPMVGGTCVTDVAVTLTVQTQNRDPQTNQFQQETKALLNVAPRNVVEVYDTSSLVDPLRAQTIPPSVSALLGP